MDRRRAIQLARDGMEEGFAWLFDRYREPIHRFIHRTTRIDTDGANDVLQNTFIRAFRSLHQLSSEEHFEGWILRIARHETLRWVENRRGNEPLDEELEVACERELNLLEQAEYERLLLTVREVAETIEPEAVRETALRYYASDERTTTEAIAKQFDVPHATVRKRLFLFRKKLREHLLAQWRRG